MAKTSDMKKTKAELAEELQALRRQVARLQKQVDKGAPTQDSLLLHALLENLPDHVYFKDVESRFIRISKSQADMFGLADSEITGKADFDFFTEEHARPAYEDEQSIIRTGEPILGIEERETWPDRPDTWVSTSKMPLRDEAGNIIGTFGISSDITARKRAELALERRSVRLQTAAEVSHAASSILDPDKLIQQVVELVRERFDLYYVGLFLVAGEWAVLQAGTGDAGRQMLAKGHKLKVGGDSMIGQCIGDHQARIALDVGKEAVRFENPLLPETRSEMALPLISRGEVIGAMTTQSDRPAAFTQEDVIVMQTMADQLANAIENARLLAERERAEGRLASERNLMRAVIDSLPEYMWSKDAEGRFVLANIALAQHMGAATVDDLVGKTDFDFYPQELAAQFQADEQALIASGQSILDHEEATQDTAGNPKWTLTTKVLLRDSEGKFIGSTGVSRDITARKVAEAERERLLAELARQQYILDTFMENVPDIIYFKDLDSCITRANRAHAALAKLDDPAQLIGKSDFDFYTEDQARVRYEQEQEIIRTGQPILNLEETDGKGLWVLTTKMALRDEQGQIIGTFGVSRDITALKEAQAALERRAAQLRAVAEVAREATAILEVRQLLDRVVALVSEGFGFYHTGIFLLDELKQHAILRAASSEGGRRMLERGHSLQVGQVGIVGYVAAANEPRVALDVGEDAAFFDNPDLPETRSELALPLSVRGEVIGVLDVQSVEPAAFTEEDVDILRTLADQLAIAIENARLVQRTEEQLRELSLLQSELSAETWARLTSAERSLGYVYDRVDVLPVGDLPSSAHDLAVERGGPVTIDASEASGAMLAVPLRIRGQVVGSLGVEAGDGRDWAPEEVALIEAVSEQVAQAIDGARLFAEAQKTALSMESLYQTSRAISSSLEEEAMIRAVLEAVYGTLGCEYVIISTVDEEAGTIGIRHGVWSGEFDVFPEWIDRARYSLDQPDILTDTYRTGRTEIIAGWDDRFDREIYEKFGHERYLRIFMPIKLRDQVIGVVEVAYDKHQKGRVSEDEVQMLAAFMDQAAMALENVRLFEQVQRRAQREHRIYEIANRLRRSPDISTILQTAVDELGQALQVDRAMVRLTVKPREERAMAEEVIETDVI